MQDERNRASEVVEKELRETLEKLLQQGDPERLIEAVVGLVGKVSRENDQLRMRVLRLTHRAFGRQSEKIDPNQLRLALEELRAKIFGDQDAANAPEPEPEPPKRPRKPHPGRAPLPAHLPREERRHALAEEERACECCGRPKRKIREEVSERLDFVPASFRVIRDVTEVYGCACGDSKPVAAEMPSRVIDGGLPEPGLLAHIAISKYEDHRVPRRHAQQPEGRKSKPCCMDDEGGPLGIGVQAQIPNHLELLGSRAPVVSIEGNGAARLRQVRSRKTSVSEPLMTCREVFNRRRNWAGWLAQDKSRESLPIDWTAFGMKAA